MWKRHWRLTGDPFADVGGPYVGTSGHDEAVARLVDSIESRQRLAVLRAGAGMGKSTVLAHTVAQLKAPNRRFSRVATPVDGPGMLAGLAVGLGGSLPRDAGHPAAWKALADAVKLCRWQRLHAVLIVENCQELNDPADSRDLQRLTHLDTTPSALLTVVQSFREPDDDDSGPWAEPTAAWQLVIRLPRLLQSETARYVERKLSAAGRSEPAFTPPALARLHDLSGGVPQGINRLGSLSLMAAAVQGLERVSPDVVDGVARECTLSWPDFAA